MSSKTPVSNQQMWINAYIAEIQAKLEVIRQDNLVSPVAETFVDTRTRLKDVLSDYIDLLNYRPFTLQRRRGDETPPESRTQFEIISILTNLNAVGYYTKPQDGEWWLFSSDGEGVLGGESFADLCDNMRKAIEDKTQPYQEYLAHALEGSGLSL